MGTRGLTGFIIDGEEKLGYQQYDSYPSGVGIETLAYLRFMSETPERWEKLVSDAHKLRVVSDATPPTAEDVEALKPFTDLAVGEQSANDWYCLTRNTQGKIDQILTCGYVEDHATFALDSLFCEWAYVIDLDAGNFEVYQGFQVQPHTLGRFASRPVNDRVVGGEKYYPIALVASWPLSALPDDDTFLALEGGDE